MGISIILNLLFLVIGMALLIKGADFFVDGASRVAKAFHIPSLIIGLTLVSIGTSLPELSVSVNAALTGNADISYGNVIGSNIFNVFVVIGASAIFTPMIIDKSMKKYDVPILLGIYGLFTIFSFVITPNILDRVESIIFCILFGGYLVFLVLRTKKENAGKEEEEEEKPRKMWVNIVFIILGLAGIVAGGEFVVTTAENLALMAGMSKLLVGLTIVAVGTSLPELVTSIVAARKGENDIAVGNAIGSCIFNVVLILGFCSILEPASIDVRPLFALLDVGVMILTVVLLFIFSLKKREVNKYQGIIFIVLYFVYLTFIILRDTGIF